jgi:hypothetical protein
MGRSILSNDGRSILSNDGRSILSNDGRSIRSNDGAVDPLEWASPPAALAPRRPQIPSPGRNSFVNGGRPVVFGLCASRPLLYIHCPNAAHCEGSW